MAAEPGRILTALEGLCASTEALARCASEPALDAAELARSCAQQLDELKALLEGGTIAEVLGREGAGLGGAREELLKALHRAETQTRRCTEALAACRDRTEGELNTLRQTQKAVTAYRAPR